MRTQILVLLTTLLAASTAFAHPGHGTTEPESWTHYLTEPVHVIPLVLAVAALAVAWWAKRRLAARKL